MSTRGVGKGYHANAISGARYAVCILPGWMTNQNTQKTFRGFAHCIIRRVPKRKIVVVRPTRACYVNICFPGAGRGSSTSKIRV